MKPITPPELAALIDVSERQRAGDWSLRAALCRYAQPQPVRVSALLDLVRRIEEGAAILVCGSAEGMAPAVHAVLADALGPERLERLAEEGRYRRDVY